MKCRSKQILLFAPAFSLVEATTALIILALVSSSVLIVINRCMASATDSALRMQAFEVARNNMETLLSRESVQEMVEYGSSDKYPEIKWQTTVETFYEPVTERMWVMGICSAEYTDTAGDVQKIELTHWLTGLTKEQVIELLKKEQERLSEPNAPSEPNEPNAPSEPNEPNRPAPKAGKDCDALPFCESIKCHIDAGTPGRPTFEELDRYLKECRQ